MDTTLPELVAALSQNLDYRPLLERCLAWEEREGPESLGFQYHQVHAKGTTLKRLVELGFLNVTYSSRAFTHYRLADAQALRRALTITAQAQPEAEYPQDLFDVVVGHQEVKNLLNLALAATDPVHVLLVGPPATAKSLFLSELQRLPGAHLALGGAASRRGITDVLLETRCRYLLLDEMEKASAQDLNVLLRLMEHGELVVDKHGFHIRDRMHTWVFAAGNSTKGLAPELLSRFWKQPVQTYTQNQFREVVERVLHLREGVNAEMSAYIAHRIEGRTWDVRDAVRIARMAQEAGDVDRLVKMLEQQRRE